jgi:ABC-type Fe3+-hydroxamate transport system substrate-binding protein
MSESCENCRFFGRASGLTVCKKLPPRVVVLNQSLAATRYPEVTIFDWCGEWKLKADPANVLPIRYIEK